MKLQEFEIFMIFMNIFQDIKRKIHKLYVVYPYLDKGFWVLRTGFMQQRIGFPFVIKFSRPKTVYFTDKVRFGRAKLHNKWLYYDSKYFMSYYADHKCGQIFLNESWEKHLSELNYPKAQAFLIDRVKKITIFENVGNNGPRDNQAYYIDMIKQLLKLNLQTEFFAEEFCQKYDIIKQTFPEINFQCCLQHGDISLENVRLSGEKGWKCIDFDTVGYLPLLYDFIKGIIYTKKEQGLALYLDSEFDEQITQIQKKAADTNTLTEFKDKYFAIFILCRLKGWHFQWLKPDMFPEEYVQTVKLLTEHPEILS